MSIAKILDFTSPMLMKKWSFKYRYQIKFMVDGEWKLSPDLAQVGEGMTINNLLVVT